MDNSQHGPWHVLADTFRRKRVYVVVRLIVPKGHLEYALSKRTGRKERFFAESIAQLVAVEKNRAAATGSTHE